MEIWPFVHFTKAFYSGRHFVSHVANFMYKDKFLLLKKVLFHYIDLKGCHLPIH